MDTLSLPVNAVSYTVAAELSPTDDPFTAPIRNIAQWHFTILAVLMFVVTSLSLSENFLVMFVTFKFKQLRQPLNYIIVNLAIADFLVSLTGGVISFLTNARGYFFLGKWACVLEGFAVTFFGRLNRLFFSSPFIYFFIYLFVFLLCYCNSLAACDNFHNCRCQCWSCFYISRKDPHPSALTPTSGHKSGHLGGRYNKSDKSVPLQLLPKWESWPGTSGAGCQKLCPENVKVHILRLVFV